MKNKFTYIVCIVVALTTVSCSKFFDREPVNKFAASSFFETENDLFLYTNGLIDSGMPGASSITLGEDLYTDFCGTRDSKNFYKENYHHPGIASGWSYGSWGFLRQVDYMLENMPNAKGNMPDEKYNHYEGVARFWRALATFNKVKSFGDCYFIDRVISPADSTLLYGPRQSREYVMHMVTEDLKFAIDNCLADGPNIHTDGRIYVNKHVVRAMASNIFLYEGTFRKYHPNNPSTGLPWSSEYESSQDFLQLAYDTAISLIDDNVFSLVSNYRSLFVSPELQKDEVIWGRTHSLELTTTHNTTYNYCSTTSSKLYSATKDYVMMFLKKDGTPAPGNISITEEFNNRDNRLAACILAPGMKRKDQTGADQDFLLDFTWTTTGYFWVKWVQAEYDPMMMSTSKSYNSIPVLRYAEVLLNAAEAAAELGQMNQALWDKTIGKLRTRAGVTNIYPESGAYVEDTHLRAYYTNVKHPVALSNIQLEIRRERATELMLEQSSRYDDLMRWRVGDLIQRRYDNKGWRGIYFTPTEATSGFMFNGKKYTVSSAKTSETNYKISTPADQCWTLSEGTYGYLIYHYRVWWDDKMYLKPVPTTAININPQLGQNDGWQWM